MMARLVNSMFGTLRMPERHLVVALTFLACAIAYSDRVNIAVAAVAMKEQFGWTQTEKGLVLSAFFVGYLLFMFAAGMVSTRFGGKGVLGWSVIAWSVCTLLTPLAAKLSVSNLIAVRIGMGVGEAALFPASYDLFGRWIPPKERAQATARVASGIPVGTVIGLMGSSWLVGHWNWSAAFYPFGAAGLLWALIWFHRVKNNPTDERRMSRDERALLSTILHSPPMVSGKEGRPLRHLLLRKSVLAIVAAHFASNWNLYVLLSWLPSYFRDVQGLSVANAGLYSAAPWLAMFASSNISAIISDQMTQRGVDPTATRKTILCTALTICAALLIVLPSARSAPVALTELCAATAAIGCTWSAYPAAILDVAPQRSAVLYGFSNTFATLPGVIGVTATGWLVDITGTYTAGLVLAGVVAVVGAVLFGFFFNAQPIPN